MNFKKNDRVRVARAAGRRGLERQYDSKTLYIRGPYGNGQGWSVSLKPDGDFYVWFDTDMLELISPIKLAREEVAKAEAALMDAKAALEVVVSMPPMVGDVFWNGKDDSTKLTVMAVIGDRMWWDYHSTRPRGFVYPLTYFSEIGYERYVP